MVNLQGRDPNVRARIMKKKEEHDAAISWRRGYHRDRNDGSGDAAYRRVK